VDFQADTGSYLARAATSESVWSPYLAIIAGAHRPPQSGLEGVRLQPHRNCSKKAGL